MLKIQNFFVKKIERTTLLRKSWKRSWDI